MKPAPFDYIAPDSLAQAIELMAEHGDEAKLLAGGQSLIPAMNFRLVQPTLMVDLNKITELDYVRLAANGDLHIGAMTRHRSLERNPLVAEHAPLITETMPFVAHSQIRNRGTIGGSLAHADPAAELPVIMVALGGRFGVQSKGANRWIGAADFFQGLFVTDIGPEEIIVEISVPPMAKNTGYSFVEFARRLGDYALIGVAALLSLDESGRCRFARLVYLNAGDYPVIVEDATTLIVNEMPSEALFQKVAEAAEATLQPTANIHASVAYLRQLARVLTVRALNKAYERAGGLFAG
jgi:carbon-monoxide dehydrogenase medium subunit